MKILDWLFKPKQKHIPKPPLPLQLVKTSIKADAMTDEQKSAFIVNNFRQYMNEKLKSDEQFQKQTLDVIRQWLNENLNDDKK
jgi:hypothetical protein